MARSTVPIAVIAQHAWGVATRATGAPLALKTTQTDLAAARHPAAMIGTGHDRARQAGLREHGRQAARSVRDRPGGHASRMTDLPTSAPRRAAHT